MMGDWGWGGWGMMGPFGWIGMLLFWALIVLGIIYLWRALDLGSGFGHQEDGGGSRRDSALEIARERYAKGEIGREEFEQLKKDLAG